MTRTATLGLGAGVQSSALLAMAAAGEFDVTPALALFGDVGGGTTRVESEDVYPWLDYLRRAFGERIPIVECSTGDLYLDLVAAAAGERTSISNPPVFTLDPSTGERGLSRRKCTRDYKVRAVERDLRARGFGPKRPVQHWLAISWDELERVSVPKDTPAWIELRWPLVERKITRQDCIDWMVDHGHPEPPRSACVFCPYHSDAYWRAMRETRPREWDMAVEVDLLVRQLPGLKDEGYLHRDRVPLSEVVLAPEDAGQLGMFEGGSECGGGCYV